MSSGVCKYEGTPLPPSGLITGWLLLPQTRPWESGPCAWRTPGLRARVVRRTASPCEDNAGNDISELAHGVARRLRVRMQSEGGGPRNSDTRWAGPHWLAEPGYGEGKDGARRQHSQVSIHQERRTPCYLFLHRTMCQQSCRQKDKEQENGEGAALQPQQWRTE